MQERCRERRLVELEAGQDLRDAPRVEDELLPRLAHLSGVSARREVEGPREQLPVDVDLVRLDLGDQLLDEVLMPFEDCHESSVPPVFCAPSPARGMRRNITFDDEFGKPMFARRRQTKKLNQIARVLRELDAVSTRPAVKQRRSRVAIGKAA